MSEVHFIRRHWKVLVNVLTVSGLLVLVYLVRHQLVDTLHNLSRINIWVLLLIIPIELINYDAYTRMYGSLFKVLGHKTTYKEMYKVALELNMVNHVFPSGGVSGFSYFSLRLRRYGISTAQSTLVQTMKFIFLFASFEILLIIGLLVLAIGGRANDLVLLIGGSLVTFVVIGTVGIAFIIGSKERIDTFLTFLTKGLNRLIHVLRPGHPETINISKVRQVLAELHENYLIMKKEYRALKWPFLNALVANLTEILAIYVVYVAFGHWINIGAVILAYAVANFAGLVSVLPGGVGIYEALMTAVLATAGVSPALSLPVTVMYRVVNMTIQILPGYYFYHKALRHEPINR